MTIRLPVALRNAVLDLIADAVDAGSGPGTIEIRSGSQPATADTAASGTLLATFTCTDPAFDAAATGSVALDADPDLSTTAVAAGTAGWARVKDSTGATVLDGSVGTSGSNDFVINSTTVTLGQTLVLSTGSLALAA